MSNVKISNLPAAVALAGTEQIEINQGGTSRRATLAQAVALASTGVTSVSTGTGLTGGPITTTGTISIEDGGVGTTQLADSGVTLAKIQNIATDRLLGRDTAGSGAVEEIAVGAGLEFNGSGVGIAAGGVTNARLADMAQSTLKGRATASTGAPEDITMSQALDFISTTQGTLLYRGAASWTVLAPGTSGQLLKTNGAGADPSWANVAGTGDVVGPASSTADAIVRFNGTTGKLIKESTGIVAGDIAADAVTTAKILANNVTYAKLQQVAAASLVGNATGSLADATAISLNATLEFSAGALQRAALTGDVTATAGSNATSIAANAVTTAKILNANVTYAKIQNVAATTLLGNPTGAPAAASEISLNATLEFVGSGIRRAALTGDVTATAGSNTTTIAANAVTYAKFQQVAASSLVGNPTGSLADAQGITLGASLSFSGTTLQRAALTGDVTAAANGNATTIANSAVTNAKMANMAANTIKGNNTGGSAAPSDLSIANVNTMLGTVGTQELFIPSSFFIPQVTGPSRGLSYLATNLQPMETLDFDQSTAEFAVAFLRLPKRWDLGTITATFLWSATSGSGNVVWTADAVAISNDDPLNGAYGTSQSTTDGLTATGDLCVSGATPAITVGGTPAAGDAMWLRVSRSAASVNDTLNADAQLLGVTLTWTSNAANDA